MSEFWYNRSLHPLNFLLWSSKRGISRPESALLFTRFPVILQRTVVLGSCKNLKICLRKMKWHVPNYIFAHEVVPVITIFLFVLSLQMLLANEGRPYIFINLKPSHIRVESKHLANDDLYFVIFGT